MPSPDWLRRRRRGLAVAAVLLVLAVGGGVAFVLAHKPGNVSHPELSFTVPTTTSTTAPPKRKPVVNNFLWPWYGFDAGRTRYFDAPRNLAPPFHTGWIHHDYALLEFPPSIYRTTLYFMNDSGWVKGLNALNGRQIWQTRVGTLSAASPGISVRTGMVYVPVLSRYGSSPGGGRFVALSMRTGRIAWAIPIGAGSESSPIVWGANVYFGDQAGIVYSVNAKTGHINWTYHASSSVKGGPAYVNGRLYFGDYAGRAYCLNAATGHAVWAVSTNGAAFGFGSGNFYSTPAVAFGRVYMGNTDGRVYSFAAGTGALAWATGTGAYVYASASVEDVPGLGPTLYLGSYDGNFYAFNARSGAIRWSHPAGGKISGSSTIVGNVVYYSDLGTKTTAGLNVRTGQQVFSFHDGAFTPVVADNSAIFLIGLNTIYELLPRQAARRPAGAAAAGAHRHRKHRRSRGSRRHPSAHRKHRRSGKSARQRSRHHKAARHRSHRRRTRR